MEKPPRSVVIAGASLAGLNVARELRSLGFAGRVTLIGAEPHRPYDRPPLSKQMLTGDMTAGDLLLDPEEKVEAEWRIGVRAESLDAAAREVRLSDGERLGYDALVIATGAAPRRLPSCEVEGVHCLRGLDDALKLHADLKRSPGRVAIIGGGFIGAELASSCRALGLPVTVIEPQPLPMQAALGPEVARLLLAMHLDHGVDFRTSVSVSQVRASEDGRARELFLSDGARVEADVVVIAVGVRPETGWLAGSGLEISDGVLCDETCRAAPGIHAAGDIARWPNRRFDETRRVEHWDNAVRQGRFVARQILQGALTQEVYDPVPWVWSDQHGRKIQVYGSPARHDEVKIIHDGADDHRLLALYRRGGKLAAAVAVNRARPLLAYRKLLEEGAGWEQAMMPA